MTVSLYSRPSQNQKVPDLKAYSHENVSIGSILRISLAICKQVRADERNRRGMSQSVKNADSANSELCGEGVGVNEGFGEKRPSVFHVFHTNKILMLKF